MTKSRIQCPRKGGERERDKKGEGKIMKEEHMMGRIDVYRCTKYARL